MAGQPGGECDRVVLRVLVDDEVFIGGCRVEAHFVLTAFTWHVGKMLPQERFDPSTVPGFRLAVVV